jgi:putative long chain acyl-CoA synthase
MDPRTAARLRRRARSSARNALELVRFGRLGEAHGAPYAIVDQGEHHRLRRYATGALEAAGPDGAADGAGGALGAGASDAPAALLVPPLMVTSEVYDVAPDVSAVLALAARGVQPFVVDFGAPERESGGMLRTLDDHIRAVDRSIDRVRELTGKDVHVLGYSQGGMFAYQSVAYRRGAGVRSVITFGSPVDIHRGLPSVRADVTGALARLLEPAISGTLDRISGLPGVFSSTVFKLLSPRKELQARVEFVQKLHDRNALLRREARRRFLGGEGFVAWPGPAFRVFFEEFIVHNRMLSGGFVIDGRTVTLADIRCPILCFVGGNDEIARPASVRKITQAAPESEVDFVVVPAGHFGLVVGSRANQITWPTVASWIHWVEGTGPKPAAVEVPERQAAAEGAGQASGQVPGRASGRASGDEGGGDADEDDDDFGDLDVELELFVDTAAEAMRTAWRRLGDVVASASDTYDAVRWQEPRLRRLGDLSAGDRISASLTLSEQARSSPESTFFLWRDRAFTYRDADVRVSHVVKGLWSSGVRPGDRVGVVMGSRPSFLTLVTALGRLGAVAVIAPPESPGAELSAAFERLGARQVACDPELAAGCHAALGREVMVLGGGGKSRTLPAGQRDLEAIDPAQVELPASFVPDAGRARDLAMLLLRPGESGELRAAAVTNHRWALSALGAAAACTLTPADTVYCGIPLHHPTGVLVCVGAAIVGGTRLALVEQLDITRFAADARRAGATVVFYAGEMLRGLLFEKPSRGDRTLPVRLFAGSGIRPELAARLHERFGVAVVEFYGSTTQRVILANASGEKPGALGRKLPGSTAIALVRYDVRTGAPVRDERGFLARAERGEPGLLVSQINDADEVPEGAVGVVVGAFAPGDRWHVSGDVLTEDEDGDHWFVDALSGFVQTDAGAVSTRAVETALYGLPEVELCAVWGHDGALSAAFAAKPVVAAERLAEAMSKLPAHMRPSLVYRVESIPLTEGFRPRRRGLAGAVAAALATYVSDADGGYRLVAAPPAARPSASLAPCSGYSGE